jgi:hypothetical protein
VVSELFSMGAKSPATSAAASLLFLTGSATNLVFLSLAEALGPYCFLVYAAVSFLAGWYVHAALPETKGRTLVAIQAMLGAGGAAGSASAPAAAGGAGGAGEGAGAGEGGPGVQLAAVRSSMWHRGGNSEEMW